MEREEFKLCSTGFIVNSITDTSTIMPESPYLQYHRPHSLPDGSTKQSKQCIRFDTLGANEYTIASYGTGDKIHVDTVPISQS
jgi:hypothetical protein